MQLKQKEHLILAIIVLLAFLTRVLTIWIGRPVFTGWFNHTYYYYVQTRGILTSGILPYPDMPLLFYWYALSAKLLIFMGWEMNDAIIVSSRFWMCFLPVFIPIILYLIFRCINHNKSVSLNNWTLLLTSAFLPLSIMHLPEYAQKNMVGILLMVSCLYFTRVILNGIKLKNAIGLIFTIVLILLTHFGSTVALMLYGAALFTAYMFINPKKRVLLLNLPIYILLLAVFLWIIAFFDPQRADRVFHYFNHSYTHSLLGTLMSIEAQASQKGMAAVGILLPLLLFLYLSSLYRKKYKAASMPDQIFWLSLILFSYLLVLPIYDQLVMARLLHFAFIPLLIVLAYMFQFFNWGLVLKRLLSIALLLGILLLMIGEPISQSIHERNNKAIFSSIEEMQSVLDFQENDLILTVNGAEHICNWFLHTKAGVITALDKNDFNTYHRIFILNPQPERIDFDSYKGKRANNEKDRYFFMMHPILPPKNASEAYKSEYIDLWEISYPPIGWEFDNQGNWAGYEE